MNTPRLYFSYTGSIIAATVIVTAINRFRLGDRGWMFTWQLLIIAFITLVFVVAALWNRGVDSTDPQTRRRNLAELIDGKRKDGKSATFIQRVFFGFLGIAMLLNDVQVRAAVSLGQKHPHVTTFSLSRLWREAGIAAYAVIALALLILDHRRYLVVIALLNVLLIYAIRPKMSNPARRFFPLLALLTWTLAAGITYTHLGDWLMSPAPSSGFALGAFVFSFTLVLFELSNDRLETAAPTSKILLAAAFLVFCAFAFRTDNLLSSWVPLHRSYFADISQFVRDGHWVLWDVPTLYGFLSMVTLATIPAVNGWQATYELTAVFLVVQSFLTFLILRWERSGWINASFAILLPLATLLSDSISRYPWSGRLYPQGGLRFFWIVDLLFIAFLMYVHRADERQLNRLRVLGHTVWLAAVLWSVENALWASIVWFAYLVCDSLTVPTPVRSVRDFLLRALRRNWFLVAFSAAAFMAIDVWYHARLGASPDWLSYVEFTGPFTKGAVRLVFHVQDFGAGWTILLALGAIGAVAIAALYERRWNACAPLTAAWFAVWGTASYFAIEPLDMYVSLLLAVIVPAVAIAIYVSRDVLPNGAAAQFARFSFAPVAIIAIAVTLGEPSRLAAMRFPFTPGWHFDVTQDMPPISGELAGLIAQASIQPEDPVLIPNGRYWTQLTQGMILPFVRRTDGRIVEYRSWLPVSPVGPEELIEGLPGRRRSQYIERFLDRTRSGGWYITYRTSADCGRLSKRLSTTRTYSSPNFSASLCVFKNTSTVSVAPL